MPSSKSGPDPLDPGEGGFAHRGLHGPGVPENSIAAFRAAIEAGFGVECDVRLSLDEQPMLFHDQDLRRLCASGLTIETSRAETLAAQRLFNSNEPIPRLAELLDLAAGRVPLLVEVKPRGSNGRSLAARVAQLVGAYRGPVGIMSFDPDVLAWLSIHAPEVRRGLVISRRATRFARWRALRSSRPHFLAVDRGAVARPWVARERRLRWIYCWTVGSRLDRETAQVHADALIWEADGRPRS